MKEIILDSGHYKALVDDDQFDGLTQLGKWRLHSDGYAVLMKCGNSSVTYMHRVVVGATKGRKNHVHHINGVKLDNRRINLTHLSVEAHRHSEKTNNLPVGISTIAGGGSYYVHACVDGNSRYLGVFKALAVAVKKYNEVKLSQSS